MKKCPKCGLYMTFKIKWKYGRWVAVWDCMCGHEEVANGKYY